MEQEVQEARVLARRGQFAEARAKLDNLREKHGITESILVAGQYVGRVYEAHRTLKLEALLKEALELASQSDQDFNKNNRGAERVKEIAKEAASL